MFKQLLRKQWPLAALLLATVVVIFTTAQDMVAADEDDSGSHCKAAPTDVPASLVPPADQCVKVQASATGVQIYTCATGVWTLKAPEASLLNKVMHFVAAHFLGPTWQWKDGSKVKAKAGPSVPMAGTIPWLLLTVTSHETPGKPPEGGGKLDDVTFIQRIHTSGGAAPTEACVATDPDKRIDYSADYVFWHPRT